jgi:hypothetical protein
MLAGILLHEVLDSSVLKNRQEAIAGLKDEIELIREFFATGSMQDDSDTDLAILREWIDEPLFYSKKIFYRVLANVLPAATFFSIGLAIFLPFFRGLAIGLSILQLMIVGGRLSHTAKEHNRIGKRLTMLKKYGKLLNIIERGSFTGKIMTDLKDRLISGDTSAAVSIRRLSKLVSAFDNRLNILAAIFLEGFLLWDVQCMIRLERWKTRKGKRLMEWIDAIAKFDAYASLANFAFNHPGFNFPEISDTTILEAQSLGHLLIPPEERITNDFAIRNGGEFCIVTGANMAGKSTFLRTVVTGMVLAMAGVPVCAGKFVFKPMLLYSSMRTSDSLNKHESYFYAELKRLNEMLGRMRKGEPLFIVLDEILKGTNSTDKQLGSRSVLRQIIELRGTGIIATHDLELTTIEKDFPERIKNMCFEIEIEGAQIKFDYKLREGVTTKMNAMLLMKQMGIIPD